MFLNFFFVNLSASCFRQKNLSILKVKNNYWNVNDSVPHRPWAATRPRLTRANWSMFYIRAIDCRNSLHVRFTLYVEHAWRQSLAACKCGCENSFPFKRNAVSRVTQVKIELRIHSRTFAILTFHQLLPEFICNLKNT